MKLCFDILVHKAWMLSVGNPLARSWGRFGSKRRWSDQVEALGMHHHSVVRRIWRLAHTGCRACLSLLERCFCIAPHHHAHRFGGISDERDSTVFEIFGFPREILARSEFGMARGLRVASEARCSWRMWRWKLTLMTDCGGGFRAWFHSPFCGQEVGWARFTEEEILQKRMCGISTNRIFFLHKSFFLLLRRSRYLYVLLGFSFFFNPKIQEMRIAFLCVDTVSLSYRTEMNRMLQKVQKKKETQYESCQEMRLHRDKKRKLWFREIVQFFRKVVYGIYFLYLFLGKFLILRLRKVWHIIS